MLLFIYTLITTILAIDRTQFSNYRANPRHDGYLSFSTEIELPLSLKWNISNSSCVFLNGLSVAFTNGIFYCLTNEEWNLEKATNSYLQAFDTSTGETLFKTYIDVNVSNLHTSNKTAFDGIVSIPPNYITIIDDVNGDLFVLDSASGDILRNISLEPKCANKPKFATSPCIDSVVTSLPAYNSIISIHNMRWGPIANITEYTITLYDITRNETSRAYVPIPADGCCSAQIPTICNDNILIMTDIFNYILAFEISNSSSDGSLQIRSLWNYTVTNNTGLGVDEPPLCIPRNDGGFNVLMNSGIDSDLNDDHEYWKLLDGDTGKILRYINTLSDPSGMPVVNTDKMVMVMTAGTNIIGYDLSSDVTGNGDWKELYNFDVGYPFYDIMIIDENMYVTNPGAVYVYSIMNGTQIDKWIYPNENGDFFVGLAASTDKNGQPMIMALLNIEYNPPESVQTVLYALQ